MRKSIICTSLALMSLFCGSLAYALEDERHLDFHGDVSGAELIKLYIPAGEVRVVGTAGTTLTAEVSATCQKKGDKTCQELISSLGWAKKKGSITELGLTPSSTTNFKDVSIHVKFGVPKDKKLAVNLSAGQLHIESTSGCLNVDVNAGDVSINLEKSQIASAKLDAKVGDVKLTTAEGTIEGTRSLLIGASLEWKGTGACRTEAKVLAGDLKLNLK